MTVLKWIYMLLTIHLSWFQTTLPLTSLPFHCLIIACFQSRSSQRARRFGFSTERHRSQVEVTYKSIVSDLPLWAKRRVYRLIGLTLLTAWFFLCGEWRLLYKNRQFSERQASMKAALLILNMKGFFINSLSKSIYSGLYDVVRGDAEECNPGVQHFC